jgi:hypothetical protein
MQKYVSLNSEQINIGKPTASNESSRRGNEKFQNISFNATFNNISVISWRSALLVEDIGEPGENHRPAANHCQTLSHNVVSSKPHHMWDSNCFNAVLPKTTYNTFHDK